jgi:hypothetical protein
VPHAAGVEIEFDCGEGYEGLGGSIQCDYDKEWYVIAERCTETTTTTTVSTTTISSTTST